MKCNELLRMLNDYVDGDIDVSICEQFQKHLDDCVDCRVVVDTVKKTITLYKEETVYEMPVAFQTRLHDVLKKNWKEHANDGA